jgi:hypothetical protein
MNLLGYIFRAVQIAPYQGVGTLTPPTVAPVLTVDADLGSYEANLSWTASNKTSSAGFGYAIWRNDLTGSGWTLQGTVGPETLTFSNDVGAGNDNTYLYYVIPFNDAGEGPSSNTASIVLPGESEAPVLTGPGTADTNAEFTLEWTDVPGADSYEVERSDDGGSSWSLLDTVLVLELGVTETSADTYKYRVTPFAGAFEGTTSNVLTVVVTTPSAPPSYLRPGGTSTYLRPDGTSLYLRP